MRSWCSSTAKQAQYVLSLAGELADLHSKEAAIELLDSGSTWAADIRDAGTRRTALMAFADRLIGYDAYENARTTLHRTWTRRGGHGHVFGVGQRV